MKRHAFVVAALALSCAGHKAKPTPVAAQAADAEFRQSYANPGGMWMPTQMTLPQHADTLRKMGVQLDAKTLADPLSAPLAAVVSLGGCTGSFVSPDGLIVTNHHCVQGALQLNSTDKDNLVVKGYVAKTRADEKPAGPAQRVNVLIGYKDVTQAMRDGLDKIADPKARQTESENRSKQLVTACEKDRPGIRCRVSSFFRGGVYQLTESLEIRDVRLVYAPARSVGDYGGEIDNWEWPRHTGDWSFFRAYVGKDGKPADYSVDNVPYHPAHHLQVTTAGLHAGDFVMVTGYPGSTSRTTSAAEVHHEIEWTLPQSIDVLKALYGIAESHLQDAGGTAIKAGVMKQMTQNGLEKREGQLALMTKGDLLSRKDDLDKRIKAWAAQPGHEKAKADIEKAEAIFAEQRRTEKVDEARQRAFMSGFLGHANHFIYGAAERDKPDAARRSGYQDRDLPRTIAQEKQAARTYDKTLDRAGIELMLDRALELPEADRPWLATLLGAKKNAKVDKALIGKTLDAWYAASKITDEKGRVDLVQHASMKTLAANKDPFIQAALRVWPIFKAEEAKNDARQGDLELVLPAYTEAMRDVLGGVLAPDANSTLRITYGTVRSLKPGSTAPADSAFTTASQIIAKDTGKEPFNSPAPLLAAIKGKEFGSYADPTLGGDLPVNFLSDLDITGGNSGSPVLNGKGELVGLAFDGNKEGVASDVVFNGAATRTIQVDARYMIWTMEHLDAAQHLVTEMGLPLRMK